MPAVNESAVPIVLSVPLSASAVRTASVYSAPYAAAVYGVQNARPLLVRANLCHRLLQP